MKILDLTIKLLFFIFLIIGFGFSLSAHGTGASFEKVIGNYKIDIGYDPVIFTSGGVHRFDFDIFDSKTNNNVDFSDVWVNISEGSKTVFASGIHRSDLGIAGMTFVFPNKGDYTLSVRFEKGDNNIVESTFPVKVLEGVPPTDGLKNTNGSFGVLVAGVIGFVLGIVAYSFVKKYKNLPIQ